MPATYQALQAVGLAQRNILATRQFFRERGLRCDCAVWYHPESLVASTSEEGDEEEAPFDANAYYWSEIRPQEEAAGLHGGTRSALARSLQRRKRKSAARQNQARPETGPS